MIMSFILILLASLFHPQSVLCTTHQIKRIEANAGLYYEPLHQVRFTRAEWKLTTSINLNSLEDLHKEIVQNNTMNKAMDNCIKQFLSIRCSHSLRLHVYNYKISRIPAYLEQIQTLLTAPEPSLESTAKRAAPFGFIGSISKTLFGTLSNEDADYYNQELDKLYQDQNKLSRILNNQTHIVKSSLQDIRKTLTEQFNRSSTIIMDLQSQLKEIKVEYTRNREEMYFSTITQLSHIIEESLDSYLNALESVVDAILFAKLGMIHPELLSPRRLEHAVRTFIEHQRSYIFPIPIEDLHNGELSKITRLSIAHHKRKLILIIYVPLLESKVFHLYQLHPYPTPQLIGNTTGSAYIQPRTNYLIMSREQERYSLISNIDQPFCQSTRYHHICTPSYPLYDSAMQPICEVSLLGNTVKNPHEDCDIRVSKSFNPYWKQLSGSKGWLYSLSQEDTVQIICGDNVLKTIRVIGAGILHLNPGCIARTSYATMLGYQTFKTTLQLELEYIPTVALNITQLLPEVNQYLPIHTGSNDADSPRITSFANLPGALSYDATLSEIEEELEELSTHKRSEAAQNQTLLYTINAVGVLAILFITYASRNAIWKTLSPISRLCTKKKPEEPKEMIQRPVEIIYDTPRLHRKSVHFSFLPNIAEEEQQPEPSSSQSSESAL